MKTKDKISALIVGALALPIVSFAQGDPNLTSLKAITKGIGSIVNTLIPIVFALAILFFFWGVAMYIFGAEHDKEKAKKTMLWGVVAIFVMASIWGLVKFLQGTLGVGTDTSGTVPTLNGGPTP